MYRSIQSVKHLSCSLRRMLLTNPHARRITMMSFSTPVAILLSGLIAGTADIGAAALINGRSPLVILLFIASGLLGKASFQSGLPAVILGLVLQWLMSLIIAAVYVLASNRFAELKQFWLIGGLAYGVGVFVVMN